MRRYNFLFFFVVLGYSSFLTLFCSCLFWDVLSMHHLVLLTFPASACFRPQQKKRIILRLTQDLRPYEISSTWLPSMFLFHVTMCDMVKGPILSLGIRLIAQLPHPILLHPFLQPSPICQTWFKPNRSNQAQFVNPGPNQPVPTKFKLSEHQPGLQDVRVLKYFIFEGNTKVLEVIEHQPCTNLFVHSWINNTSIVRN